MDNENPVQNAQTLQGAEQMTGLDNPASLTLAAGDLNIQPQTPAPAAPQQQPQTQPNMAEQMLANLQEEETALERSDMSLRSSIASLLPQLEGEAGDLAAEQQRLGIANMRQNLQGINNRVMQLNAELFRDDVALADGLRQIKDKPIAMEFIQGQQASVQERADIARGWKMAEINMLNAQALAMQGNITLAQEQAKNAVDAKYAPIRASIATREAQLKLIEPLLTAEDKKQAFKLEKKWALAMRDLDKREENEKTINALGMQIAGYAPEGVLNDVLNAKTPVDAIRAAGKYVSDPLDRLIKARTLEEKNMNISKIAAEIAATQTEMPNPYPVGSEAYIKTKMLNSAANKESLSATERQSMEKALTVVDQIDSLERSLAKVSTGPLAGRAEKALERIGKNPSAGVVKAQLQALIPGLARGIYGEVGVLTDTDIQNYMKTVPNLTTVEEQNQLLIAMTLKTIQSSVKNKMSVAASSQLNVADFVPEYEALNQQIWDIEDRIGVTETKVNDFIEQSPDYANAVADMYEQGFSDRDVLNALGLN